MKKRITKVCFLLLTVFISSESCKKSGYIENDTSGVLENANAERLSNDIVNMGIEASYGSMTNYRLTQNYQVFTSGALITFDSIIKTDNDTLLINFGTGTTGQDSRIRKGMLMYIYPTNRHYRDSGIVISVSTPGNTYYCDGEQIVINSKTVTNHGHISYGMLTWSVVSDLNIVLSTGKTNHWVSSKTKVLLAGEEPNFQPIAWSKAKVAIFGSSNGTASDGSAFTTTIAQNAWLVRDFTCGVYKKYFVSGTLQFFPTGHPCRYLNYGTGNCDNQAVVTISGQSYNITLP